MDWDKVVAECTDAADGTFMATVGPDGRPHVAWVGIGFATGSLWTATHRSSQKAKNLRAGSEVALHWPEQPTRLIFIRACARLVNDPEESGDLWDRGVLPYDPATFWESKHDPELQFVELTPYRASIHRGDPAQPAEVWTP